MKQQSEPSLITAGHTLRFKSAILVILIVLLFGLRLSLSAQPAIPASGEDDSSQNAVTYNVQGMVLLKSGAFSEASTLFERAIELNREFVPAYINLGASYNALDRPQEAVGILQRALSIDLNDAEIYCHLGLAYRKLREHRVALAAYQKAISLNPRLAEAHNGLGLAYRGLGQHDQAAEAFQRAIQFEPAYALAHNNLGVEHADLHHYPEAIAAFERAIAINSSFSAARFNLGVVYLRMKRRSAALEQNKALQDLDRELADKLYAGIYEGKILSVAGK